MENTFTLVLNAGRSGSSFLASVLETNWPGAAHILHEGIPAQVTKPRVHNRAYEPAHLESALTDPLLGPRLRDWQLELENVSIIETGWTAYHLAPVLHHLFGSRLRIVTLHRDPISFAFSRACMGNYHPQTWYDDAHEVSPFDPRSIAPSYQAKWQKMNHFEKCLFWWYVVYKEGQEFVSKHSEVPHFECRSQDLFSLGALPSLATFLGLEERSNLKPGATKNELNQFVKETFPVKNEWRAWNRHADILAYAEGKGYKFDSQTIESMAGQYGLKGLSAQVRHYSCFWRVRRRIGRLVKLDKQNSAAVT